MKAILGDPIAALIPITTLTAGTAVSAVKTALLDTRNFNATGAGGSPIGAARHVSISVQRGAGVSTNQGAFTLILSHAASSTDAATNATALATITSTNNPTKTDNIDRFEVDMIGLQPVLKLSAQIAGTGGTSESVAVGATAILGRQEQTPYNSSALATGNVVIIACGGVTQSN